jgi:DNA-binding NarL/FixJ family response regulator
MCFVLIVEDNFTFRQSLKDMLAIRFPLLEIQEASNDEEAITALKKAEPALIFMDIKLPGKNGLELTKMIKKLSSSVEVVILTSYDIPEYREAAFQSGASHFFTKGNAKSDDIADVVKSTFALKGKDLESCVRVAVS